MNRETLNKSGFQQLEELTLPIFSRQCDGLTLFYAPGYLAAAAQREAEEIRGILTGELPFGNLTAHYLIQAAVSAENEWRIKHDPLHYKPTCLTLYTSLACSLKCAYCFAERERQDGLLLAKDQIMEAARTVLENCREKNEPFTAVFHGGGEPTLDPRLPELLSDLRMLCEKTGVPFRSYLATNGVMEAEKARFIAENFERIGLSVDGPPDIQNRQRPLRNGGETASIVQRTASIIREVRSHLTVRVTVLPENFSRIPELAAYCSENLGADEIRIEPVYHRETDPETADVFCEAFLQAEGAGFRISYSGSRICEIHGRYCQVFRQVLQLVPPNGRSACFVLSSREEAEKHGLSGTGRNVFKKLMREDPACEYCFNRFHCARGCPDVCPAADGKPQDAGSFRCRVNQKLAEAELLGIARRMLYEPARKYGYAGLKLREG